MLFFSPSVVTNTERECTWSDFEKLGSLGQGAFGKVWRCRHRNSKVVYAIKEISKEQVKKQRMIGQLRNEAKIMYALNHPNIIKLYNHFEENDSICLIMEFAKGGQLYEKLTRVKRFDEKTAATQMADIVSGMEYIHNRNPPIIHRDIKPENILIDEKGKMKVADFGWSNEFKQTKRKTYCGTLDYLAPEMIVEKGHDVSLDAWCLGVLTFELLSGYAPFSPPAHIKDPKLAQQALENNIMNVRITFPKDFPPLAKDFVNKVLKKNPPERLTTTQMKSHPWFKGAANGVKFEEVEEKEKIMINPDKADLEKLEITEEEGQKMLRPQSIMHKMQDPSTVASATQSDFAQRVSMTGANSSSSKVNELKRMVIGLKQEKYTLGNRAIKEKQERTKLESELKAAKDVYGSVNLHSLELKKMEQLEDAKERLKKEIDFMYQDLLKKKATAHELSKHKEKVQELEEDIEKMKGSRKEIEKEVERLLQTHLEKKKEIEKTKDEFEKTKLGLQKKIEDLEMKLSGKNSVETHETIEDLEKEMNELFEEIRRDQPEFVKKRDEYEDLEFQIRFADEQNKTKQLENSIKLKEELKDMSEKADEELRDEADKQDKEYEAFKAQNESELRELEKEAKNEELMIESLGQLEQLNSLLKCHKEVRNPEILGDVILWD